tara:strand:+ start:1001 stop:1234 length:234 start_codon:yes stop_codon:yes gene_type:complete
MRTVTCSTRLSEPENEKLLEIKEETGTCISTLIRDAVCFYLRETGHAPRTPEEEQLSIKAKQQDDLFFQEYEEASSP